LPFECVAHFAANKKNVACQHQVDKAEIKMIADCRHIELAAITAASGEIITIAFLPFRGNNESIARSTLKIRQVHLEIKHMLLM
jgi:hypothetical protein